MRKSSSSVYGQSLIYNELQGIDWYSKLLSVAPARGYCEQAFQGRKTLDIEMYSGKILDYRKPITKYCQAIKAVFNHYDNVWPCGQLAPYHGDLTLDNIIFTSSGPRIFDWEHFSGNSSLRGFDLIYLLLSALILPNVGKDNFKGSEMCTFESLWSDLRALGLSEEVLHKPLDFMTEFFQKDSFLTGVFSKSPQKFIVNLVSHRQKEIIHGCVG